jgi:hypothetical protein
MLQLTKTLHVLAVGLWFGMAVFFSFPVALSLFATYERIAQQEPRPVWFPTGHEYDQDPGAWNYSPSADESRRIFQGAANVRREQGVRAAGAAIAPLFDWYFLFQGACAILALITALGWPRAEPHVRAHRLRVIVLLVAFATVAAGWPLERQVSALRVPRDAATDALLQAAPNISAAVYEQAAAARSAFGAWHGVSTLLNLGTIALVTVAMALTARLPPSFGRDAPAERGAGAPLGRPS